MKYTINGINLLYATILSRGREEQNRSNKEKNGEKMRLNRSREEGIKRKEGTFRKTNSKVLTSKNSLMSKSLLPSKSIRSSV